jgi:hypothetical protein
LIINEFPNADVCRKREVDFSGQYCKKLSDYCRGVEAVHTNPNPSIDHMSTPVKLRTDGANSSLADRTEARSPDFSQNYRFAILKFPEVHLITAYKPHYRSKSRCGITAHGNFTECK